MEITVLGTAAIGYPLAFCNCDNCKLARIHKGKSIRKCASILINDDLLIDLGPDVQTAMTMYDKDFGKVRYLLQTHIHNDHYDERLLGARKNSNVVKNLNKLEIYAHPQCLSIMSDRVYQYEKVGLFSSEGASQLSVEVKGVSAGDVFSFGAYEVKAIESKHDSKNGSLLYLVNQNNKNFLYAVDTPVFTNDVLVQLQDIKLDILIMDHTYGDTSYSFSHLNEKLFIEQIERLKEINCVNCNTKIYGTHISHDGTNYHELLEKRAIANGYNIAYDGMKIKI